MKHSMLHLIGCALPLLLIFLLPLFGLGGGVSLFLIIVLLFACHLFMMIGHGHGQSDDHTTGGQSHEHH